MPAANARSWRNCRRVASTSLCTTASATRAMSAVGLPNTLRVFERGWLSSNNVLAFDRDGGAALIDTGYVSQAPQTVALVEHALAGRELTRILNTHLHSDHCGGNAALLARFGAALSIPPGHAPAVAAWDEDGLTFRATGQRCARFMYSALLAPGSSVELGGFDWQVLAAPGHDPHQVMLWCASERILISADVLWHNGFGAIFPEIEGESGFAEQRALLATIAGLQPSWVIPGHGAPFTDVAGALTRAQARLAVLAENPARNARQVAKVLVKFYLLEVRSVTFDELAAHFSAARYFQEINARYVRQPWARFMRTIVDDLIALGAAAEREGRLIDKETSGPVGGAAGRRRESPVVRRHNGA
jgi:glyoxylase-like metal-dependent hydrolase (beta-lactamase superfamily II)